MTGFPHETKEELEENVKFMKETKPQNSVWGIVTPYPGTELHKYATKEGILPDVNPIHLMHHSPKTSMADIPLEQYKEILRRILRIQKKIVREYWLRNSWYGLKPLLSRMARPRKSFKELIDKLRY